MATRLPPGSASTPTRSHVRIALPGWELIFRVTNVKTGRSVVCRVTDRGPFVRGRIVDLSRASARAIGMSGTARVEVATASPSYS